MFVFIGNTPREYAWGSTDALPLMLGTTPTGAPQAELWLGSHPGDPSKVVKATPFTQTLLDLIEGDPEQYGVDGQPLPFLMKVLAIASPLSLQVHPTRAQAQRGFLREEAAEIPRDAFHRNYRDENHKPEVVVALGNDFRALCGFRPLADAAAEIRELSRHLSPGEPVREALDLLAADLDAGEDPEELRARLLLWAFSDDSSVGETLDALRLAVQATSTAYEQDIAEPELDRVRLQVLTQLFDSHQNDPGVLISILMHLVQLQDGDALFLQPGQLHAYLSGVGVEVMAASDNVLRAGLTQKHIDSDELASIVGLGELAAPLLSARYPSPGMTVWEPEVPDFRVARLRVSQEAFGSMPGSAAPKITAEAKYPLVGICTAGRLRVERQNGEITEVASVAKGQSLYVSAGERVCVTGDGEAFVATVGEAWPPR